jgi:DNA-binding transcriptional MerR regulator
MPEFFTTGRVAAALGVTEPRLAELVRRGRIVPAPAVVSGRRLWTREHVRKAAALLKRPEPTAATLEGTS